MKKNCSALFSLLCFTLPAMASVSVSSPTNGSEVKSPFTLNASAATCSSENVSAITYSLDSGSDLKSVHDTVLQEEVDANAGTHTIHVKAWGDKGTLCVTDVEVKVTAAGDGTGAPSSAATVSNVQTLKNWTAVHDARTPGSGSGSMSLTSAPSRSGVARKFVTRYGDAGGIRYSVHFGDDTEAENFLYDSWVYIDGSAASIANLEMDVNQVIQNGWTVIFGFQCDGYSKTWDYAGNTGTAEHPNAHWHHTSAACNPRSWTTNAWHHVQVSYSRDVHGVATYHYVTFDGVQHNINVTILAAKALGWGPSLTTNFQVDGLGKSGENTIYVDNMTISRW